MTSRNWIPEPSSTPPTGFKLCRSRVGRGCGDVKPVEAFYANARTADGLASCCRECVKADERARYWRKPEKSRDRLRLRRVDQPGRLAALQRAGYAAEPEKHRAVSLARYHADPETAKARQAAYREANRERLRERDAASRAQNRERINARRRAARRPKRPGR
jgi:hypothetical protein